MRDIWLTLITLLEKAMAPHSSTFAWRVARVGHDWATSLSLFTFHFHALEKEMATHSSALAWRIPGTGKPGGLPSMGLHRVGHNWSDFAAAAAASPCNLIQKGCLLHGTTGRLPIIFYWGGNLKWFMVHACSNLDKDSTDYNTYRTTDDSKSQLQCVNWLFIVSFIVISVSIGKI